MYAAENWTLFALDTRALEDFHVRCQRQILGVRWFDFTRNDEIALLTGLLPITDVTRSKTPKFSIFSHRPSVCQRLFQPTKPYAATSMHHSVDHLITHENVDQATHTTTGWSTSVRTPAFQVRTRSDATAQAGSATMMIMMISLSNQVVGASRDRCLKQMSSH